MKVLLCEPEEPAWEEALSRVPHEFYHLPDYLVLEAHRLCGQALGAVAVDGAAVFAVPVIVREWPGVGDDGDTAGVVRDATAPYGYAGPTWRRDEDDPEFARAALRAISGALCERGVCCLFLRLSPFLGQPDELQGAGTLVTHGQVVWIDLEVDCAELNRRTRPRVRTYASSFERQGGQIAFDETWVQLPRFVDLYHGTMRRVGADAWYFLPVSYFEGLREIRGCCMRLCTAKIDGTVIAAALFGAKNGIVQYLFSGSEGSSRAAHAMKGIMVFIRDWAKGEGHQILNLGGGLAAGEDGLFQFKAGFSPLRREFSTFRSVLDGKKYGRAVAAWERVAGRRADEVTGFFPAYRKQVKMDGEEA